MHAALQSAVFREHFAGVIAELCQVKLPTVCLDIVLMMMATIVRIAASLQIIVLLLSDSY